MFVLDSHCDTPSQILRLRDMGLDNDYAHVDFPKLKRGGVDGAFFALYVPAALDEDSDKAYDYAMTLLDGVNETLASYPSAAALATSRDEAYNNKANGKFSVLIGLENASPIDCVGKLKCLYDKGIRYITLCHSLNNAICDSCAPNIKKWGGLSPLGREIVAEMNRLGILIDVSHVSDDTFYDVLKYSTKPVVATHSCCRTLCDHPRNMTDDMIRELAAAGGVIQINFYPLFLDPEFKYILSQSGIQERGDSVEREFSADPSNLEKRAAWNRIQEEIMSLPRPDYKMIADHIDHVVSLVGVDYVGIGSDFDGIEVTPDGMEDISMMPKLFDELCRRGYTESDLEKIASGNFFRCLSISSDGIR